MLSDPTHHGLLKAFLHADPPLQDVFSSLKSPQSLSPSQAQWSGIQRPLVHWNWVLEQDWMHPTSSLPSPQSSSTHMHKHSWKVWLHKQTKISGLINVMLGATDAFTDDQTWSYMSVFKRFLSLPESQCHFTLIHRPLEQLNWVRGSQVGKAEKGWMQVSPIQLKEPFTQQFYNWHLFFGVKLNREQLMKARNYWSDEVIISPHTKKKTLRIETISKPAQRKNSQASVSVRLFRHNGALN